MNVEALPPPAQIEAEAITEIAVAPLDEEGATFTDALAPPPAAPELMGQDEFYEFFSHAFMVAGAATQLKSVETAGNLQTARPCAIAIYNTASRFPWMQWLIRKEGQWVMDMMAISAFGVQLHGAVMMELTQRAQQAQQPEAA